MEIDELFLGITDMIGEVTDIKWIDMDFGQMDSDQRPPVGYPCALISIDFPQISDLGNNVQKPKVLINVKLCFDYQGETSVKAPPNTRIRALSYYPIVKSVYKKLQGQRIGTSPMKRTSQIESARPDRIKILQMTFETVFVDDSAR
ncbi:hypothetical protein [Rhodonellum sp.]|uniref:hypothetical protein n=1 Tax=Rhodonellum sp. TaxID=2231180 RepID=UPI0027261B08|nr:hypothetical protein [Rhodonellum sp.]MDO9554541.1 hypothetical protein [Rhodonellum sp.]